MNIALINNVFILFRLRCSSVSGELDNCFILAGGRSSSFLLAAGDYKSAPHFTELIDRIEFDYYRLRCANVVNRWNIVLLTLQARAPRRQAPG